MKTIKVGISHSGMFSQVVKVPGGTLTVKPNDRLKDVDILPLSADQVRHYADRGIIFSGRNVPKNELPDDRKSGDKTVALEKAVADAQAALKKAEDGNDPGKIAGAKDTLAKAEADLMAAKGGA